MLTADHLIRVVYDALPRVALVIRELTLSIAKPIGINITEKCAC